MIPALTVRQPWASAFFDLPAARAKDVENRGWSTNWRGRIAIHAGLAIDEGGLGWFELHELPGPLDRDRGHVLGTVDLTGCHEAGSPQCVAHRCDSNPWAFWPTEPGQKIVHWVVEHPRRFVSPIRARGLQTLWSPDPSLAYLIETAEVML